MDGKDTKPKACSHRCKLEPKAAKNFRVVVPISPLCGNRSNKKVVQAQTRFLATPQ
jgi:hypothetical protein